ncbi:serine hydrolase [Pontibacillus yanchengensis]|uniref:Serine hydrolase n=1 Tax=Pontibacillus yanchengensis TaxID=462910 RepID=A0ACC7VGM6_9BACI|nr:serine hydrolase [Pontibacillus yanchengensis]MYL53937.1 serine hydrolase [Pontibacillus yanchengensis]
MINRKGIDEVMEEGITSDLFPGAVCHISKSGETIYHKAFGTACHSTRASVKPNTLFDIASLTKVVTTTLILKLASEKKVNIDERVGTALPKIHSYSHLTNRLSNVTIRDLLIHQSGLPAWFPFYSRFDSSLLEILEDIAFQTEPVQGMVYSDLNFMLLGEVIQYQANKTLDHAVETEIVAPLHLETLSYHPLHVAPLSSIAATEKGNRTEQGMCRKRNIEFSSWRSNDSWIHGEVNDGNSFYFFQGISGHAGLFSTAKDLDKIGQLYWRKGGPILSNELVQEASTDQGNGRGLGWQFDSMFPSGFGHTGFTGTSLWICPEEELVCVVLTNRLHQEKAESINGFRRQLHERILNQMKEMKA